MAQGDRLLARLREIDALDGVVVSAGLQGRGEVAPGDSDVNELVVIGRAHEYGITVPERPWLRTAMARHGRTWVGGLKVAVKQRAQGDVAGSARTLRQVGVVMVDDIQQTIATGPFGPLAEETIRRKGSDVPLIDSAQMQQSVRAAVEGIGLGVELIG